MTFNYNIQSYSYNKVLESPFLCPYTPKEYQVLVELSKKAFNKDFTNDICVRLDGCKQIEGNTILTISRVCFYDFLLTNFLYFNYKKITNASSPKERKIIEQFYLNLTKDETMSCFSDIIEKKQLSNILAVSCLVSDGKKFLITKRNGNVGISNNFYSTTVTGSIDGEDFITDDPIKSCCAREFLEETNYNISPEQMVLKKIVLGQKKIQPIALIDIKVNNIDDIVNSINNYKGFQDENNGYYVCNSNEIKHLLEDNYSLFTEATKTHLEEKLK